MFSFYNHFPTKHVQPLFLSIAWRGDFGAERSGTIVAEKRRRFLKWVRAADLRYYRAQVPDLRPRCALVGSLLYPPLSRLPRAWCRALI